MAIRDLRAIRMIYAGYLGARIMAGYKLLSLRRKALGEERYAARLSERHLRSAERVYQTVLRLQGLMIKIGQTMGSRPDLLPAEYALVLSRLQDRVPPRPWKEMRPYIQAQLGSPVEEVFAEFNREPVAAASLAQVYQARLKDGRRVAVKVVYPGIDRLVKTDLWLLRMVIWLETRFMHYPLGPVYDELSTNIPYEVDMLHEGRAMEEIAAQLSHRDEVVIPQPIWEHCRQRILVMEYVDGIKITDLPALAAAGIDTQKIFTLLAEVYFEQMLKHGHFHADPHPGNLLALPGNRLAILDFGLTKRFSAGFRAAYQQMTRSIFTNDNAGFIQGMREAGFCMRDETADEGFVAMAEFFRVMGDPETYRDKEVIEAANEAWIAAFKVNPMVEMPGEIVLPMRVLGLLFGLGATVGGGIDLGPTVIRDAALRYTGEAPARQQALAAG